MPENGNGGLLQALLAVQAEVGTLPKDATNPHFHSKYTPLDTIVEKVGPVLNRHGLVWSTFPTDGASGPALQYVLTHAETGQSMDGVMPLLLATKADRNGQVLPPDMQGLGSAITYARRYSLCSVLNLVADDDDDGNAASSGDLVQGNRNTGAPSDKQLSFLKSQVTKAQNDGLKPKNLRTMLDKVGASDVEIREGWMQSLTKGQVSGLLDIFKQGVLPTGDSDLPSDVPAAPVVEPGDDIPFPTADEGKELRETTGA